MKKWLPLLAAFLAVAYGIVTLAVQFMDLNRSKYGFASFSIPQISERSHLLAAATNAVVSDSMVKRDSSRARDLDLKLPPDVRVYLTEMLGPTNAARCGSYYFFNYYLFPRKILISVDGIYRHTREGQIGRAATNDAELRAAGFDVVVDLPRKGSEPGNAYALHPGTWEAPRNSDWFHSKRDWFWAFILPPLTGLAGLLLLRLVFPQLKGQLAPGEQLASGFGLGMMAVGALTPGIKLCGFHGYGVLPVVLFLAAGCELWVRRKALGALSWKSLAEPFRNPVVLVMAVFFVLLFRLAGVTGLVEFDAIAFWMLKAKMFHLYTGPEIIRWFSEPRFDYAHMDYPILMPALHATTWDTLGHVDDFVSKFWLVWMLFGLVVGLFSMLRSARENGAGWSFLLLGVALMPAMAQYAIAEGGTMPMIFFTVLGWSQIAVSILRHERARMGLGLVLVFGAVLTKFEGMVALALALGWLLLLPSTRRSLKLTRASWRAMVFCALAAVPFVYLRAQIPTLHFESSWLRDGLRHPVSFLASWPQIFLAVVARLFLNPDFASWDAPNGHLHWNGHWEGLVSLVHLPTLGLAWLALALSIIAWLARPSRRSAMLWVLGTVFTMAAALSAVFSCFVGTSDLTTILGFYTMEIVSPRQLLPFLITWAVTMVLLLFLPEEPAPAGMGLLPAAGRRSAHGRAPGR